MLEYLAGRKFSVVILHGEQMPNIFSEGTRLLGVVVEFTEATAWDTMAHVNQV